MLFSLIFTFAAVASMVNAAALPGQTSSVNNNNDVSTTAKSNEYHYTGNDRYLRRRDVTVPITYNEKTVGTTELPLIAPDGTVHPVTDGHHFFHPGWFLTDTNGGAWIYLPHSPGANATLTDLMTLQSSAASQSRNTQKRANTYNWTGIFARDSRTITRLALRANTSQLINTDHITEHIFETQFLSQLSFSWNRSAPSLITSILVCEDPDRVSTCFTAGRLTGTSGRFEGAGFNGVVMSVSE